MPLLKIVDLDQPQSELAPYIQRAQSLSALYYAHIASDQNESYNYQVNIWGSQTRAPGIHASEISKCMRQIVYCITGAERKPPILGADTNMLMRFRLGTAVHALLQTEWHRVASKSGLFRFRDEAKICPELGGYAAVWNLHSSADGEFTLLDQAGNPEVRVGLEIKTIAPPEFEKLKAPQHDHIEQATVYMAALDLPLMWILYYNKGNSNITESFSPWLVKFDRNKWELDLEIRFARCTHMAQEGQLPDRTEGMHCKWCSFAHLCGPQTTRARAMPRLSSGMRR